MKDQNKRLVRIYSTPKQSEIVIIKSLLDSEKIPYFITNENLNVVYGAADGFTAMDILVPEEKQEEAKKILNNFIAPS